jgi:hypothetical protein
MAVSHTTAEPATCPKSRGLDAGWRSPISIGRNTVLHTQPPSRMLRGAMVVLGTLGTLALVWTLGRLIRAEDEFSLRIHLAALGVAFGTLAVCLVSGDLLVRAGFVDDVSFGAIWMGMLVIWWLSIVITTRYYQ